MTKICKVSSKKNFLKNIERTVVHYQVQQSTFHGCYKVDHQTDRFNIKQHVDFCLLLLMLTDVDFCLLTDVRVNGW